MKCIRVLRCDDASYRSDLGGTGELLVEQLGVDFAGSGCTSWAREHSFGDAGRGVMSSSTLEGVSRLTDSCEHQCRSKENSNTWSVNSWSTVFVVCPFLCPDSVHEVPHLGKLSSMNKSQTLHACHICHTLTPNQPPLAVLFETAVPIGRVELRAQLGRLDMLGADRSTD